MTKEIPYGLDFQRGVFKLMATDEVFCAKACHHLNGKFFTGELKWFFNVAKSHYENFKEVPSQGVFETEALKHEIKKQQYYFDEVQKIFHSSPSIEKTKRELTGFIRANIFVDAYQRASDLFNAGSKDNAYEITSFELERLNKIDFERERVVRFGDHEKVLGILSSQKRDAIPTGIRAIDDAMNGGLYPGSWTTFIGGSNSGKSLLTCTLGYFAVMSGKKVFCTIHEDEEFPTKCRWLSRFSGIPFARLMTGLALLSPEEREMLARADEILKENVVLRFMYTQEAIVERVLEAARMLHKEWPFHLFLCDYGQCLTSSRFKSMDNPRMLQEYVYGELKQICLELNIAGAGGAQTNRQGHALAKSGADYIRCTDVAEAFGIVRKSSNVITMNRSNSDAGKDRIVYLLDKVRNGICPIAVECVTDYNRCRTHTDEVGSQAMVNVDDGPNKKASRTEDAEQSV